MLGCPTLPKPPGGWDITNILTSQPPNFSTFLPPRRITFGVDETLRRVIRHKLMYGGVRALPLALAVHAGRQYGALAPMNGAAGVSNK